MSTTEKNITDLIDLLHKSDDYHMDLLTQMPADTDILEMVKFHMDGALRGCQVLMKKIYSRTCPECSAPVVNGVCQSSACKGRLL